MPHLDSPAWTALHATSFPRPDVLSKHSIVLR